MKMGMKEFRERLGEVARGDQPVQLTDRGEVIGTYTPRRRYDSEVARKAVESIQRWQEEMRAEGYDLDGELAKLGMDPWGVPLEYSGDR